MFDNLLYEIDQQVATITMNRPDSANGMDQGMIKDLVAAFRRVETEPDVRVVVLRAKGKLFSGGGDMEWMNDMVDQGQSFDSTDIYRANEIAQAIRSVSKPVVAAVHGTVAGGAAGIIMACDFRIMSDKAKIVPAFSNIGLSGDTGLIYSLMLSLGFSRTYEIMALGQVITAQEANDWGLVTRLTSPDDFEEKVADFIDLLMERPTLALARQKQAMNEFFYQDLDKFGLSEAVNISYLSGTEDFKQAIKGFVNKEEVHFQGK
ncbi:MULTISPECIES: enoyl-CoA hydratase/isomerase family protein [Aerococcus]|uniref:enoyl-CoA hydratase/isomerase family protein n=1 Tax=Aerococcus TaxID=1375 RepID=UPI000DCEBE52|nr:enoyl-CoA hydratase-related protein [Aerococcus urinae]RAV94345.1 hypothetical protein DBT53_05925 [Aerococcus mictus]MDK6375332.1 enoyl-CoA hydratase-related protein [Aerococcus urinae]MDK6421671.1 enoyl-CoA hydratase-related protein [Aerococcus urinae]MDK8075673.1 enoyl-CoA hydratase-related protein [Aerococcus urinae]MDK8084558.1 enoyl-CoA hydratase-related protein [Aerococcus urinae]